MLVLNRKLGERIFIADNIVVTVVKIERDVVRLGVMAPRSIPVNRLEVHLRVLAEASKSADCCQVVQQSG